MADSAPAISVVIGTRNRSRDIGRAVGSILGSAYPRFEVIVVDQSDDTATRDALSALTAAGRVRLVPDERRGLAEARNLGIAQATGDIIAETDDDCEVAPDWLQRIADAFVADPMVGVVFGCVHAAPYDHDAGFLPAYEVRQAATRHGLGEKAKVEGIGACMAVRRSVWADIGGFDELLGAGAPFRAGEDTDFMMRALLRGYSVSETPDVGVVHYGFRPWEEGRRLIADYMFGLGATNAKMLRLGKARAIKPLAALAWRWMAGQPVVDLNHLPPRLLRLGAFLRGMRAGFTTPLDPATGRFAPRS
jgi:glycosyltransferase involved in cell wall biosynthesis